MARRRKTARLAIPRRLVVRGQRWRVVRSRTLRRREGAVGLCDAEDRVIQIDVGQSAADQERTYLHELLHAMFPDRVVSAEQEERIVGVLEGRLYAAIRNGALALEALGGG